MVCQTISGDSAGVSTHSDALFSDSCGFFPCSFPFSPRSVPQSVRIEATGLNGAQPDFFWRIPAAVQAMCTDRLDWREYLARTILRFSGCFMFSFHWLHSFQFPVLGTSLFSPPFYCNHLQYTVFCAIMCFTNFFVVLVLRSLIVVFSCIEFCCRVDHIINQFISIVKA